MNPLRRLLEYRQRPAWIVLLLCLSITLLAWYGLRAQMENNARQQFELHVRDVLDSIEARMREHEQILLGGVGLFDAEEQVTRQSWHAYVERLNLAKNYPGIQGVGFSRVVKPAELGAHIASVRKEGFPQFTVRPPGERALYTSIVYLEPFSGRNLAAFGFDMMSEPTRAKAMRAAVDNNGTTITNKLKLVQETHGKEQAGLLMYLPVYRHGSTLATREARWAALQGFVYSPYRVGDLMAGIMANRALMLDFSIYDGEAETEDARMYDSSDEPRSQPAMMSASRSIDVYGKVWTVKLNSRPEFEAGLNSSLHRIILALGSGISLLFFMLVSFLISRREQAEEIAAVMTADIRANEHKLRLSEARIHGLVEGAEHIIISTDITGIIQSFNGSAERHLGYRAEELVGKSTPAIFHVPDEVVRCAQSLTASGIPVEPGFEVFVAQARRNPGGDTREWHYVRKDGSTFPVSLTVTALRDESGTINAFLGIATDISEQVVARQLHRDDETRMAAILNNVLDGIITINERGDIETFNKAATQIFGYSEAEVAGKNVKMLMPEPYHGEHDGYLHNYVTTGHKKIIGIGRQVVGQRKDGTTFPMDLAVSEMELGDKRMFTGIVRDITERVKVERMKSEFISTVSHELRTPLTSIRGSLALLVGGVVGDLPVKAKPLIDIAHKNSERLILLVNDILDMEKIEAGKMEFQLQPVKLMPLLSQALEGNRAYAEQYKVHYELENELPEVVVQVDANRLMQVFANLLSNAAKFSPAGGKVSVAVARVGQRVRVAVKDNGAGIPDEFKERIFQKFAQADSSDTRKKGGTGLGLSITKAIVEQMGGRIGFESQPNVLTEFYVEFPEWLERHPETAQVHPASEHRVLVCEDSRDTASVLRETLESAGYTVDVAYDAHQAKQLLAKGHYVAMTLDLGLPMQDGLSLIRELRQLDAGAKLPVLVISATANEGRRTVSGEGLGIVDWLLKPFDAEHLLSVLKRVVPASGLKRVLHIEDDGDVFNVVHGVLQEVAETIQAGSLSDARKRLAQKPVDLVILDLNLAGESGKVLIPGLKAMVPKVPILVFSAYDVSHEEAKEVDAVLLKSRSDNAQLLATVKRLIGIE